MPDLELDSEGAMITAAISWRVSTADQKEISPDTQKDAARNLVQQ